MNLLNQKKIAVFFLFSFLFLSCLQVNPAAKDPVFDDDFGLDGNGLLDDYEFNFKYSKPDLYELAQLYSKEIQKKPSSFIFLS